MVDGRWLEGGADADAVVCVDYVDVADVNGLIGGSCDLLAAVYVEYFTRSWSNAERRLKMRLASTDTLSPQLFLLLYEWAPQQYE